MTNKDIARSFKLLADLMDLHGENGFKVRAYRNAYNALRKFDRPLNEMSESEIASISGVGKSSAAKIIEMLEKGSFTKLDELVGKTPDGVREMLQIRGVGPSKVRSVWHELGIESPVELLYACNENRLVELKGFGLKTQADIRQKIEFYLDSRDNWLYAGIEENVDQIVNALESTFRGARVAVVGEVARKCPVVHSIDILIDQHLDRETIDAVEGVEVTESHDHQYSCNYSGNIGFTLHTTAKENFISKKFKLTGSEEFVARFNGMEVGDSEEKIFEAAGLPYVVPELRESAEIFEALPDQGKLITVADLKGIVHNHSTYSDGLHELRDIAIYVRDSGYAYFGISDHSQTAVYAGGLKPADIERQWAEIDALNDELAPFRIFKGIESDILTDGSLDYDDELLAGFDFVVASIHSGLKMDEEKATRRLLKAIEHPATAILGHPTARLLLAREGYPIDHMRIIDACAENNVSIELNANPLRLDLDYRWIPYAVEKGVMISINPDAHSKEGIHNVKYGVYAARKGGLTVSHCLNALSLNDFARWLAQRH